MFESGKRIAKLGLGKLFGGLLPHRKKAMQESFTLPYWDPRLRLDFIDKLIRFSMCERLRNEKAALEDVHRGFWKRQSTTAWYAATNNRLHDEYIPKYGNFVDRVVHKLGGESLESLVEFGAGDGSWLNYLSKKFVNIGQFVGVDLCEQQVEKSRAVWPKLSFECEDLVDWLRRNRKDNTLYHTNSGVLEYLSEQSVFEVLSLIKSETQSSFVFLIEAVSLEYDLKSSGASQPLGPELCFSHNYRLMLENLDYEILLYSDFVDDPYRRILMLAKA